MEDYLEALERLGRLLDAGVLTKEEFEREKAALLSHPEKAESHVQPWFRRRTLAYVGLAGVAVVIAGGGMAYAIYGTESGNGESVQSAEDAGNVQSLSEPAAKVSISFADPTACEPGPTLADLLDRVREAAAADEDSDLGRIRLAGAVNAVQVQSSTQDSGHGEVRLGRIPVVAVWQGLAVTELRTTDWAEGTGFQIHFRASGERLLRTLRAEGFEVSAVSQPLAADGRFIAIENTPTGSILTCIKSNDEEPVAATSADAGE